MDAQARKKAMFRAKLKENDQKRDKRINSPLVRYNENDQPICRVCDIILKSESFWQAHQVSRKHHEAINIIKANATGRARISNVEVTPEDSTVLPKPKVECSMEPNHSKAKLSSELNIPRPSSQLPSNFFDTDDMKRPKTGVGSVNLVNPELYKRTGTSTQMHELELVDSEETLNGLSSDINVHTKGKGQPSVGSMQVSNDVINSEKNLLKGALPEGFFDDKDSDLRARGIEPVKLDVKDEYKEFEKLIQVNLKEVDDRLEEEEFDAAETIEEAESLDQK